MSSRAQESTPMSQVYHHLVLDENVVQVQALSRSIQILTFSLLSSLIHHVPLSRFTAFTLSLPSTQVLHFSLEVKTDLA